MPSWLVVEALGLLSIDRASTYVYFIFKDPKSTNYYLQEDNNIAEVWFFTQGLQLVGRIKVFSIVPTLTLVLELVEADSDCWSNPHNLIGD